MQEYIGKVCIDDTWYPGEDLYSDGAAEDRLLKIAQNYREEELNGVIAREKDWTVLYHMSHIRENLISWLPLKKTDKVLEIGSGCGAVTGALAKGAGEVTCVELSRKRSLINANRHKDCENLTILLGNFQEVEPHLHRDYDYVTLIGVLEYARSYIGGKDPYRTFLQRAVSHLKPGGRLVLAIENRLGLKYWAGCREDHTGRYFDGLLGYPRPAAAKTFSKPALERLFEEAGLADAQFYYPYPDYKLPMKIFSDAYLPKKGELAQNIRNFDRSRLVLFDEKEVYDTLIEDGLFPLYANSFLCVLGPKPEAVYIRYSNERSRAFSTRTVIKTDAAGGKTLQKCACYPQGNAHVEAIAKNGAALARVFEGSGIAVNDAASLKPGLVKLAFLENSRTLEEELRALWKAGEQKQAESLLSRFTKILRERADVPFAASDGFTDVFGEQALPSSLFCMPVTDIDMVPENLLRTGEDTWTLVDYEWTFGFPVPANFVIYRMWRYFLYQNTEADEEFLHKICQEEGLTKAELFAYPQMEDAFQAYVTKGHTPLRELYGKVTPGAAAPKELGGRGLSFPCSFVSTLYYGERKDASEEASLKGSLKVEKNGEFEARILLGALPETERTRTLWRFDPLEGEACRIRIREISPQSVFLEPENGFREETGDVFWTYDPVYRLFGTLGGEETLCVRGELTLLRLEDVLGEMTRIRLERDAYAKRFGWLQGLKNACQKKRLFGAPGKKEET